MRARELAILCVAGAAALVGCETLIGAEFDEVEPRGERCQLKKPPERGSISNAGGDTVLELVLHNANFGDRKRPDTSVPYQFVGYDVDDNCGNRGEPPLCRPASWTIGDPTDGVHGEDNGTGQIITKQHEILGVGVFTSDVLSGGVDSGVYPPIGLLRISDYNGAVDDDAVTVDYYLGGSPKQATPPFVPAFDGSDVWPVLDSTLATTGSDAGSGDAGTGFGMSIYRTQSAYVVGGVLVAMFDRLRIPLANVFFSVRDVALSATVRFDLVARKFIVEDGLLGGKATMSDMLALLPEATSTAGAGVVCTDSAGYPTIKRLVCLGLDTYTDQPTADGSCDAASVGIAFDANEVTLAGVVPEPPSQALCPPQTAPGNDTCSVEPP